MSLSSSLLPEFDQELTNLRKTLERVPDAKLAWKPHAKSMSLGGLATHLANVPSWGSRLIDTSEFDLAPPGQPPPRMQELHSRAEILATFDANFAAARKALAGASDATLLGPWTLLAGGKKLFTLPRNACLRSFTLNHMIHHRGQLTVYLRLLDVPLPALYGPSADEGSLG
jgi:uncharacterized damage-inducible protein DinB